MINEIMSKLNIANINANNIAQIFIMATIVIAVIAKLYIQIKNAIVKALRVVTIVIGIVCLIGIQQGVFGEWVTKLTTYIK